MWKETAKSLPTATPGEQVEVLMWSPQWATWLKGLYTHLGDTQEWALYNQQEDRYEVFAELPMFWMRPWPEMFSNLPEIALVADERTNQIINKGWDINHDRILNPNGELVHGAIAYAKVALRQERGDDETFRPIDWPWDGTYWNPSGYPARNLAKAAAMLLAEARRITTDAPPSSR